MTKSDKLSYSTCKDTQISDNETSTAAASRAEHRIILQCIQRQSTLYSVSFPGQMGLLRNSNSLRL